MSHVYLGSLTSASDGRLQGWLSISSDELKKYRYLVCYGLVNGHGCIYYSDIRLIKYMQTLKGTERMYVRTAGTATDPGTGDYFQSNKFYLDFWAAGSTTFEIYLVKDI